MTVTELDRLLTPFLYILTNKFFRILLEHLVDLVQERVDVLGHLLVAFGDLGVDRGLDLVGPFARARRLLLSAGVPGGHGLPSGSTELLLPESYSPRVTSTEIGRASCRE